ncbi:PadR family transcriptional regulator [Streptomyces sp. I6]|uniref:PadR family transcriptional regulator n=1 Tax=Streptomyces sp. I6 TaxID=2483113 RepID=UPI0037DA2C92
MLCKVLPMEETSVPRAQWLRGVLDMCLLALMAQAPVYGYEMTVRLGEAGLDVADGSIYPALARLRKRGLVEVERRAGAAVPRGPTTGRAKPVRSCFDPGVTTGALSPRVSAP